MKKILVIIILGLFLAANISSISAIHIETSKGEKIIADNNENAKIYGYVLTYNFFRKPLSDVKIALWDIYYALPGAKVLAETTTDSRGYYSLDNLPVPLYFADLELRKSGYQQVPIYLYVDILDPGEYQINLSMFRVPKNKVFNNPFNRFLEQYPGIFPLLRNRLGL